MRTMQFLQRMKKIKGVKRIRIALALAVAAMGLINGLTVLLPTRPWRLGLLSNVFDQLAPFAPSIWSFIQTGRTIALIAGFFLLLIAFGLARGKRRAWQVAIVLLPLSVLAHIAKGLDVEEALLAMILWFCLIARQSYFLVESDPWRIRQGIVLLICGFVLLFLYSLSGLYLLREQFLKPDTFGGVLRSLLQRVVNIPAQELQPLTRHADWFLRSIPALAATALLTGMFFLLRPVSASWWVMYQKERLNQSRQRVMELVRHYGSHTLAFFALASENLHYLAPNGEGLVNYRLTSNVAVILGDPVCEPRVFERVTRNFLEFCELRDWHAAFYQAHPEHLPTYHALGLHAFKIGEEAMLFPQTFTLAGSAMANVRTSSRRAEREGVSIQWYDGVPPEEVLEQLRGLSRAWLERKGGKHATEMGFSMGRLDELIEAATRADMVAELNLLEGVPLRGEVGGSGASRVREVSREGANRAETSSAPTFPHFVTGVASDTGGTACAFVTFTPIYGSQVFPAEGTSHLRWGWALDLMRRVAEAPPGVIELLLVRAMERFRDSGAEVVSLGMVAMADTKQEMTTSQRQVASFVSDHLRLLETHRSLFHFKQKFHPCWESRYVVASTTLSLPKIALAILRIHQG